MQKNPNKNWLDNHIQFPRLLAEINACGLTHQQYLGLCESMDLTVLELDEILDRAEAEWLRIKEAIKG